MRQPLVLGLHGVPLARLGRQRFELLDDPAHAVLFGERAGRHCLGLFARALFALPVGPRLPEFAALACEPAVLVEQRELGGALQQRLVRVLAVHVEQELAEFAQLRQRHRGTVDVRLAAAAGVDGPAHQHARFVRVADVLRPHPLDHRGSGAELGADLRARRAFAHHVGVGALAEREQQGVDEDGLARAGLAGEHGEAGREVEFERLDDDEVADCQRQQHR